MKLAPFDGVDRRMEFIRRLNTIPGISIAEDAHSRRPSFSLSLLATPAAQTAFTEALTWVLTENPERAASTALRANLKKGTRLSNRPTMYSGTNRRGENAERTLSCQFIKKRQAVYSKPYKNGRFLKGDQPHRHAYVHWVIRIISPRSKSSAGAKFTC